MRNRLAVAVALAVALAAPATHAAETDTQSFEGKLESGGTLSFRLQGGNAPDIDMIRIRDIPVTCEMGSGVFFFKVNGSAPVYDDRTFSVRARDGSGGKARVKGRFSRSFKRAKGTARVFGEFNDGANGSTECDSGKLGFVAK